jgi:hypothetical protein
VVLELTPHSGYSILGWYLSLLKDLSYGRYVWCQFLTPTKDSRLGLLQPDWALIYVVAKTCCHTELLTVAIAQVFVAI